MTIPHGVKRKCFVISPIGQDGSPERRHADLVLKYFIKAAIQADYDVMRADDDVNPGAITPRIIRSILDADLIVADITGSNANVFYELAIAHGYNKPTVHIMANGERPPFDIKDVRIISYDITNPQHLEQAQRALAQYVEFASRNPNEIETPLRDAQQFKAIQTSGDPATHTILRTLEALRLEVRLLRGRIAMSEELAARPSISALGDKVEALRSEISALASSATDDEIRASLESLGKEARILRGRLNMALGEDQDADEVTNVIPQDIHAQTRAMDLREARAKGTG